MSTMTKTETDGKSITTALRMEGWKRSDYPANEVGECSAYSGCSRPGRWSHPHVAGTYCAQHALNGG